MKKALTIVCFLLSSYGFSQKYLEKLTNDVCECIENVSDSLSPDEKMEESAICFMQSSMDYRKQIKRDYDIDLTGHDASSQGEKLGRILGVEMMRVCPKILMKFAGEAEESNYMDEVTDESEVIQIRFIRGKVISIKQEQFIVFNVKDHLGNYHNFYWIDKIESPIDLPNNYTNLENSTVRFGYDEKEIFDARIKEYRTVKVISRLEKAK